MTAGRDTLTDPQISTVSESASSDMELARARLERQISRSFDGNVLLLCKQCRSTVAALRFCTGSSRHFNPSGYLFHIGEFSRAAGVKAVGEACSADSWFQGCAWRIAICRQCQTQLGWRYESAATSDSGTFWGLIWNRLLKARRPDS
ncbi:CRBN [Symbiodinium natans]|uniref:CRBN protein n=1 Tax=Symbiodinium natans TaxID=878477 RepID=A0A812LBA1_9DINO|nr:CRBN [Symbiodinium natans]